MPPTSVLQSIHFELQREPLYLVIYSSLLDCHHLSYFSSFLSPSGKLPVRSLKTWINCQVQGLSLQLNLVIYSSLLDLPSHSHGQSAIGDMKKNKTIVIFFFIFIPKWQNSGGNVMTSLKAWINCQVQGLSLQLKNGCLEVPTSSPGSSRFPIWRRQERRPWHTAN